MKTYKLVPLNEVFELYRNDQEDGFKNPKEAIKWCNLMYTNTGDTRYKQISKYLKIYLN